MKLIDVYPDRYTADPGMGGYQLMIAGEVFRAQYRSSFEKPAPVAAGSVQPYTIAFPANDHVFRQGHRIMVRVLSTFPLIDRNPERFVPNIYLAEDADFQAAERRVFRAGDRASHVVLPVVSPPSR